MEKHFSDNEKALEVIAFEKNKITSNACLSKTILNYAL